MGTLTRFAEPDFSFRSREDIDRYQQRLFQELLCKVWKESAFYREYYASHGIREQELPDVTIGDLPFINKRILMENFDHAVTDPRLRIQDLEQWLNGVRDPNLLFHRDFIGMHSSGPSGTTGIFVYRPR